MNRGARILYGRHGWVPQKSSQHCWKNFKKSMFFKFWFYCLITVLFVCGSILALWYLPKYTFEIVFTIMASIWSVLHFLYWQNRISNFFTRMNKLLDEPSMGVAVWEILSYFLSSIIFFSVFRFPLWVGLEIVCGCALGLYGCTIFIVICEYLFGWRHENSQRLLSGDEPENQNYNAFETNV